MLFDLGHLLATPSALKHLGEHRTTPIHLIGRHAHGDWGDIHAEDRKLNDQAVRNGFRLLSAYRIGGARVYVITEWDRSCTTVLLASEY
ncbi:hypothetical protein CKY39_25325 [Variovorax boronicumulans]|uniref:Type I restriction endonuclease subunit M n=1 Tax=Variovorax boronicumulans TaxID=436515 RepID=A0A250DPK2_9BURK|nr:hypothetical protein [Variovorax boronicumulans]ATA56184.1 hypothetical protein CKY39_25325 [Variovorax boronicumulans]